MIKKIKTMTFYQRLTDLKRVKVNTLWYNSVNRLMVEFVDENKNTHHMTAKEFSNKYKEE